MITTQTSIVVYRFIVYTDITLRQFLFNNPMCICPFKNKWRVTYHGLDYSMNIFVAKKLSRPGLVCMVFAKQKPLDEFYPEFERLFGSRPDPKNITVVNRVEKFYTPYSNIDFEGLYDDLDKSNDIEKFFIVNHAKNKSKAAIKPVVKIPSYVEQEFGHEQSPRVLNVDDDIDSIDPHLSMDLQKFCAIMIAPFPEESNVMIEVFASGVLNVAGIPSEDYFHRIKRFVEEKLAPLLENNSS